MRSLSFQLLLLFLIFLQKESSAKIVDILGFINNDSLKKEHFYIKKLSLNTSFADFPVFIGRGNLFLHSDLNNEGKNIFFVGLDPKSKIPKGLKANLEYLKFVPTKPVDKIFLPVDSANSVCFKPDEFVHKWLRTVEFYPFIKGANALKEFWFNDSAYSVINPTVSPNKSALIFSSNKPGGIGGFDLYISLIQDSIFSKPFNLGPIINTPKDEISPSFLGNNTFFYASNLESNYDIFCGYLFDNEVIGKEKFDSTINSKYNEVSFISDSLFQFGYFSSDRPKTTQKELPDTDYNIYLFTKNEGNYSKEFLGALNDIKKNDLAELKCVEINIESDGGNTGIPMEYFWDMGDGNVLKGLSVRHCYSKTGNYRAVLKAKDLSTGVEFDNEHSLDFKIRDTLHLPLFVPDTINKGEVLETGFKTHDFEFEAENIFWRVDNEKYASGKKAYFALSAGYHKVEVLVELKIFHAIKRLYYTKKVFVSSD